MDDAVVEKLKGQFPGADLVLLKSQSAEVVARVTKSEVDLFRELITQPAMKARAMERFVRSCIVHPGGEELNAILLKKPALVEKWSDQLFDLAGADEEVELKKL